MEIERKEEDLLQICPLCKLPKKLFAYGKGKLCHECIMDLAYMKRRNLENKEFD